MTRIQSWCLLAMAIAAAACASPKVGFDYDSGTNFSGYRTYEWMPGAQETTGDKRVDNSLVDSRIRAAVGSRLREKGYTASMNGKPDFYVAYHVAVKDRMKGASTQQYIGDYAYGTYTTISDIHSYNEGDLLVDIIDADSKRLVWRASAQAEVDPGMTPDERDRRIGRVVGEMFSHFPPK